MKKPMIILFSLTAVVAVGFGLFFFSGGDSEPDSAQSRDVASTLADYDAMNACDKQASLWREIKATEYKTLPDLKTFGLKELWQLGHQEIATKGSRHSDFAPKGWTKYLHARGVIAKIKIVPRGGNYTGVFGGADCALLRLSLTFKPGFTRGVAPGLALKVLRDHIPSANVSALVSLAGQGKDFNFFRNPLSNIVPIGNGLGQRMVHDIFSKVSNYPEELAVKELASADVHGAPVTSVVSPRQLFFTPASGLKFSSDDHDFRTDLLKVPSGTVVYKVLAAPASRANFDYGSYSSGDVETFIKESEHIADLVTTSEFVASSFGDSGIFFRHELR